MHGGRQGPGDQDRDGNRDARGDIDERFAYRITSPVYKFHLGVIDVIEIGPLDSLCVYSTTAEPDTLALIIAGGTVGALEHIKLMAEGA